MATTANQELQESFLSAISKSQEITLNAIKAWAETVGYFTPKVSYARLPLAYRSPTGCPRPMTSWPAASTSPSRRSPASGDSLTTC